MKSYLNLIGALAMTVGLAAPAAWADNAHRHGHQHHQHDAQSVAVTAQGIGEVRAIGKNGTSLVMHHEPMPELNWPAMVMRFAVADAELTEGLGVGDKVSFRIREVSEGEFEIDRLAPLE
ncbi:copper-binding protein [Alkalilimnicola ehrlichii]|nr:copper-binding protein [Alkalilimnicola ehrlichii]